MFVLIWLIMLEKQDFLMQIRDISASSSTIKFRGLQGAGKALVAVDLDGTRAHNLSGHNDDFNKLIKSINSVSAFVTGRFFESVIRLRENILKQGFNFPLPNYIISRNGLHIFENIDGKMVEDKKWNTLLSNKFSPQKSKIMEVVKDFAFRKENIMPRHSAKFDEDFSNSKLCKIDFFPDENLIQFLSHGSISRNIDKAISEVLKKNNIDVFVIRQRFSRELCDFAFNQKQLSLANPRFVGDEFVTKIDILPSSKGESVIYLKNKLSIPNNEIVSAGDDANDKSLADLIKEGIHFIAVKNSTPDLKNHINELLKLHPKVAKYLINAESEGVAGISEGIRKIISQNN